MVARECEVCALDYSCSVGQRHLRENPDNGNIIKEFGRGGRVGYASLTAPVVDNNALIIATVGFPQLSKLTMLKQEHLSGKLTY